MLETVAHEVTRRVEIYHRPPETSGLETEEQEEGGHTAVWERCYPESSIGDLPKQK